MNDTIDLLQVKIENAKKELSEETRRAIDAVDWRKVILDMRLKKGYSLEQLEDLELETELLLCGLINTQDYPKELANSLKLPRAKADQLANEMNELVFKKIRDEMIKLLDKKQPANTEPVKNIVSPAPVPPIRSFADMRIKKEEEQVLEIAGIKINEIPGVDKAPAPATPQPTSTMMPIQKLSGAFQMPAKKTEYTINNISKTPAMPTNTNTSLPKADPYREPI
ncbi:MAG: hypothetical protein V4439_02095 [Patescibacteria group bacterium]